MTLFEILARLDYNDADLRQRMTPADREYLDKNISWLIPQWMVGASNDTDHKNLVLMFDELLNTGWHKLYGRHELQAQLLSVIGLGKKTHHKFYRPTTRKFDNNALLGLLRAEYPDIHESEVALFCRDTDIKELEDLMYGHGLPVEEHDKIVEQFEEMRAM